MSKSCSFPSQEELYKAIIDTFADIIITLDRHGKIIFINRGCERISGYLMEETVGKYYWDVFLNADELELFKAFFENLQASDFPFHHGSFMLTKQGESRFILWSYNIDKHTDDLINRMFLIGLDVTERRFEEEALREKSEDIVGIINALPVAVVSLDREGKVKSGNDHAERVFGWEAGLASDHYRQILPDLGGDEFDKLFAESLKGKYLAAVKTCARKRDGQMADIQLYFSPLRDTDGRITGVVLLLVGS